MKDYKQLAIRYLKMNRRRSLVTIFGAVIATMVLYCILNLGWSKLLQYREQIREKDGYEIVLFTETQQQIEAILADDRVKDAYVGSYYYYDYNDPVTYDNALYLNTNQPYQMDKIMEQLKADYGVEGEENYELAWTYMQGDDENTVLISTLTILLISFIFAIFGVGIVRNSIQLSTLEQLKDYGNLRCIGATKKELKKIVYCEGMILELTGMVIGVAVGTIATLLIGHFALKITAGFHWIPIVPILVAFLGDLYFAMEENCKLIANMSPVSAIRGEYRIHKEKIKVRKSRIFGKLFGVEGDYAYKSIMRNPGRFMKTVWSIGIGMGAFILIMGFASSVQRVVKDQEKQWKYYHIYYAGAYGPTVTLEEAREGVPPTRYLKKISKLEGVTDAKKVYRASVLLKDYNEFYGHTTDKYRTEAEYGAWIGEELNDAKEKQPIIENAISEIICDGYDEEDYARYQKALVAGTLDVSDHGIVLVNHDRVHLADSEIYSEDTVVSEYREMDFTDYQVGDTIDLVDMEQYYVRANKKLDILKKEYQKELEEVAKQCRQKEITEDEKADQEDEFAYTYHSEKAEVIRDIKKELVEEGAYTTYTIEGIVNEDVNMYSESIHFVLPLDHFYQLTGTDESMSVGMRYHFDHFSYRQFSNIEAEMFEENGEAVYGDNPYAMIFGMIEGFKKVILGGVLIIVFVVTMTALNIMNTTASSLYLRKKEFAQLRVIGMSKARLTKMVMLEGVIATIVANIIGIAIGFLLSYGFFRLVITSLFGYGYSISVLGIIIGMLVSVLILCGSVYLPLRGLKQDVAADLATGGE